MATLAPLSRGDVSGRSDPFLSGYRVDAGCHRRLRSTELAQLGESADVALRVVRDRFDETGSEAFISFGNHDADAARLLLADTPTSTFVRDGQTRIVAPRKAWHTSVEDLRPSLHWRADHALDLLSFVVPKAALDRWADEAGVRPVPGLMHQANKHLADEVIAGFGQAILPCLDRPDTAPRLFVDQVLHAMCGYLARTYGAAQPAQHKGGLAPWQERRAKELIAANLDNQLSLHALATECRLSISHFTKAFKTSLGQSPHQWLLERRIEHAKTLLVTTELALSEVATTCGFADQSHFSRAFSRRAGWSPGAWRRAHSNLS
ncbi:helix-turn-helix domain-containing protein [Sphingomonas nostoxanthinifaciens]|uniref:helix-turn-helix domain-containing protein n=1 Tax=Sphingomonas nostoxanthinifaciens TaxID=2872652 RepID=UPI001CC20530|nr:AraC family transcriptional regulator [Sphingomonas nostoxanthinifaciens]UAK26272.1 AraC family transcriptional regulator [Sphingomonas nostoxanthinifaciens]